MEIRGGSQSEQSIVSREHSVLKVMEQDVMYAE